MQKSKLKVTSKNSKLVIILVLVLVAGAFLRLWWIDKWPVGFTPDEAAQGYTAYSILKTGRDEWGVKFPLNLRSFGDFKPPLQTYLIVPSIAVFGLNEFAVRLPNAFLGSLAILGIFFLAKELFTKEAIGLVSAFLLAFSPWHIMLSRGAFEANLTVFFSTFGFYFLLKALRGKARVWQILAAVFLGLNMFSYHTAKLLTPLVVILFLCFSVTGFVLRVGRRNDPQSTGNLLIVKTFLFLFICFLVVSYSSFFAGGQKRGVDIAIFNPTDKWKAVGEEQWWSGQNHLPKLVAKAFHNKVFFTVSQLIKNYLSYFSPQFLFSEGPGEGTYGMIPGRGVLWWWELPVLLIGLAVFLKKPTKKIGFLLTMLLLAPLPAVLTKGTRMANRAAGMMPFIQMLTAWSIWKLKVKSEKLKVFKNTFLKRLMLGSLLLVMLFAFVSFLEDYFVQSSRKVAKEMLCSRCEAIRKAANFETETIIVSRKLSEPQTYVMFCLNYPPSIVQGQTFSWLDYERRGLSFLDQLGEYQLGKYIFREINWASDSQLNAVLVGLPSEFPESILQDKKNIIHFSSGEPGMVIYEASKK